MSNDSEVKKIYLDNTATHFPKKEVIDCMLPYMTDYWLNPSSPYAVENGIKGDVERARQVTKDFLGANTEDSIIFTSGATESNNTALKGFYFDTNKSKKNRILITTPIEHSSILECIKDNSMHRILLDIDKNGLVSLSELENLLNIYTIGYDVLVSIHHVNNEVGSVQNIEAIGKLLSKYDNVTFHVDATQSFGKLPLNVKECNIDMLSASGHKIGTPKGIGILYVRNGVTLKPLISGKQEGGMRGGTENVPYIIAWGKAVELASLSFYYNTSMCQNMRKYAISKLKKEFPDCVINCEKQLYPTDIISFTYPCDVNNESLSIMLSVLGVYVATGSACNTHSNKKSYVLKTIGLSDSEIDRTIRISLGEHLSYKDIDSAIEIMETVLSLFFEE